MAKWVADTVLDGALGVISGANRMLAVAAQPSTFDEAWAGRLAEVELVAGDFLLAPGAVSGRKVAIAGKAGVPVLTAGTASHVALVKQGTAELLYVTTCPQQQLVTGGSVSFDPWSVEIGAPA